MPRLTLLAQASRCQIDHRNRHPPTKTDRTGGMRVAGSATGEAWRPSLRESGSFRRPRRILRWVGAKSADRDLLLPRLRQQC